MIISSFENENVKNNESVDNERAFTKRDFAPHRRTSYRICKSCGKMYILSDNDAVYFIQKYGSLPLRCEKCREKKWELYQSRNNASSDTVEQ